MPRPLAMPMPMQMGALACTLGLALLGGCKDPPKHERVPPPKVDDGEAERFASEAHREALEQALPLVRAALIAADPLAAYQVGLGPAAGPPLSPGERRRLEALVDPAHEALAELDESRLPGAEVVILRLMRFALVRLDDELHGRPRVHEDPMVGLHAVAAALDELRFRLIHDDCDATCERLPAGLANEVETLGGQLRMASLAGVRHAASEAGELAGEARALARKPALDERAQLRDGLDALARACDEYGAVLEQLEAELPSAAAHAWDELPNAPEPALESVRRLPDILGPSTLVRRLRAEQHIDLRPGPAFAEIEQHVARWEALREELIGEGDPLADERATPVDAERCEAALARLRAGLEAVPEIPAPVLDCPQYLAVLGDDTRSEGALVLELLDVGVIEPQRRALRSAELPEVALVSGQWSTDVHMHLRRIMLLARLSEPAASALALAEGRRALCWAEAAIWIHAALGPPEEVALTVGGPCVDLGDAGSIVARVTGDPRAALAGFGLSLIGESPARMVGFDRFFWAPLGLMKTLATPKGMHPDSYSLPDDPTPTPAPAPTVTFEKL